MNIKREFCLVALLVAQLPSVQASYVETTLLERVGGQAYYDATLDITWIANPHLAASNSFGVSGIGHNGTMDWQEARGWINAMNRASYLGVDTWRLPVSTPLDGSSFNQTNSRDGSTDIGTNISAPGTVYAGSTASELAYMFYNTLGHANGSHKIDGRDYPCAPSGLILAENSCLVNSGLFDNPDLISISSFWTETEINPPFDEDPYALSFSFYSGTQTQSWIGYPGFNAWAVTDGDPLATVPLPATAWLMLGGIGYLGTMARRSRRGKSDSIANSSRDRESEIHTGCLT